MITQKGIWILRFRTMSFLVVVVSIFYRCPPATEGLGQIFITVVNFDPSS